jgi:hypothetical protein
VNCRTFPKWFARATLKPGKRRWNGRRGWAHGTVRSIAFVNSIPKCWRSLYLRMVKFDLSSNLMVVLLTGTTPPSASETPNRQRCATCLIFDCTGSFCRSSSPGPTTNLQLIAFGRSGKKR